MNIGRMSSEVTMVPAVLEVRDLSVRLGGRDVLRNVNLALRPGSLCALAGPNGAGKSTLLRAMAGVVPSASGQVRCDRSDIAFLPQDRIVHWDLSVARVVALGRLPHQRGRGGFAPMGLSEADRAAIERAMVRMHIQHLGNRPIREVSGGERARVLIARALAQETPVLLADEPVASLDPGQQLALFGHLRELARGDLEHEGRAVMVALHDLSLAVRFADRVILLHKGRIAADGPPREALSRENIAAVFGIDSQIIEVDGVPVVVPMSSLA